MAVVVIAGFSNSGKTTSLRFLPPESTFIVNINKNKTPSFPGFKKKFKTLHKEPLVGSDGKPVMRDNGRPAFKWIGNYYQSDNYDKINTVLNIVNKNKDIKYLVVDDVNYIMGQDIMSRIEEKSYDKYSSFAAHYNDLIDRLCSMREDMDVVIVSHIMKDEIQDGTTQTRMTSASKSLDKYAWVDGRFDYILYMECLVDDLSDTIQYVYRTRKEGNDSCRSVYGVFKDKYIEPNIMKALNRIHAFENGDEEEEYPDPSEFSVLTKPADKAEGKQNADNSPDGKKEYEVKTQEEDYEI